MYHVKSKCVAGELCVIVVFCRRALLLMLSTKACLCHTWLFTASQYIADSSVREVVFFSSIWTSSKITWCFLFLQVLFCSWHKSIILYQCHVYKNNKNNKGLDEGTINCFYWIADATERSGILHALLKLRKYEGRLLLLFFWDRLAADVWTKMLR